MTGGHDYIVIVIYISTEKKKLHLWFSEADLFLKSQHFRNAGDEIEILIFLNSFTIFKNLQFFMACIPKDLAPDSKCLCTDETLRECRYC